MSTTALEVWFSSRLYTLFRLVATQVWIQASWNTAGATILARFLWVFSSKRSIHRVAKPERVLQALWCHQGLGFRSMTSCMKCLSHIWVTYDVIIRNFLFWSIFIHAMTHNEKVSYDALQAYWLILWGQKITWPWKRPVRGRNLYFSLVLEFKIA